jgi:carboxyl-terminal processing protease
MNASKVLRSAILMYTAAVGPVFAQADVSGADPGQHSGEPFALRSGSYFSASGTAAKKRPPAPSLQGVTGDFAEALDTIRRNHVSRPKTADVTRDAIDSMLKALDPHSNYFTPDEFRDLLGEHESEYSGIGTTIAGFRQNGEWGTYVLATFPGSPAARAGLRFGDRIVEVDGVDIRTVSSEEARNLVRGRRGSVVKISFERNGSIQTAAIRRDVVHQASVPRGTMLSSGVGYIDLTAGFSNATAAELETALKDLRQRGVNSLVLDLRGNEGGILEAAIKCAEKFLAAGRTIVSQRGRTTFDTRVWRSANPAPDKMPMVVLVDENSASAAEVLAGALQDNDRAIILGQKTFGKGLVQNVLRLPDSSGLTLTAARYFTPAGRSIQRDYSDGSLYGYFNHKTPAAGIGRPIYAARTLTNRTVYGGDGITPDELTEKPRMTRAQADLQDPVFFFVRSLVNGETASAFSSEEARRQFVLGEPGITREMMELFGRYTTGEKWDLNEGFIASERTAIERQIRYMATLAASGTEGARRTLIADDPEIARAVRLLPKAAELARAAAAIGRTALKQKDSPSRILDELR